MNREQILKHKDKLSVQSYNEFYGGRLHPELVKQYEIDGLNGMLLSPRSPEKDNSFMSCSYCHSGMRDCNIGNENPPKFSIANGFAIGSVPKNITYVDTHQKEVTFLVDHECDLTSILCAAIAPVRPYAFIFLYMGGQHKSIRGNFQFFEMDQSQTASALTKLNSIGLNSNIYVVLAGTMTPAQKNIVRQKKRIGQRLVS